MHFANELIDCLKRTAEAHEHHRRKRTSRLREIGRQNSIGWRKWIVGSYSIAIWTAIGTAAQLLKAPATPSSDEPWLCVPPAVATCLAIISAVTVLFATLNTEQNSRALDDERLSLESSRLSLAMKAVQRWLDCCQGRFGHGDYRVTLLLCRRNEDSSLNLEPVLRDRNHPLTDQSAKPRISDTDASLCEGVAGNAWNQRAPVEASTEFEFASHPQEYAADLSITAEFAQACTRASRYYLGIPLLRNHHPLAVVTIDSIKFGCLTKQREAAKHLRNAKRTRHQTKLQEFEQQKDYILESLITELFIAGGVNLEH